MGKTTPAIITILLIMVLGISCSARNSTFRCIEPERNALLRFRASLDASNRLSSWSPNNHDCCSWEGVDCNRITGHVIRLDLSCKLLDDLLQTRLVSVSTKEYDTAYASSLRGKALDSSLVELQHLTYLDLSLNDFQNSRIPAFLGSMEHLQHLNLSNSNFDGLVPRHLGNLSRLSVLDLSCGAQTVVCLQSALVVHDLRWMIALSSLEYLDMSGYNLSSTKHVLEVLNTLPSLRILRLSGTELSEANLPHACLNSTLLANVWHLDLSSNSFHGGFPCFIQNMTALTSLDLSFNMFNFSRTSQILGLKSLVNLNLASFASLGHEVDMIFSEFLKDKCHLKSLNLSNNLIDYNISRLFRNLSGCWSRRLESLALSYNNLYGHIPSSLANMRSLRVLKVARNELSGQIPSSLANMRSLRVLNLASNELSGQIPVSLGQLSNLESIDVSFNSFEGTFSEAHLGNLSKLEDLRSESNRLGFDVGYDWVPPFQLKYLNMRSSKFGGRFPKWLPTQRALVHLDLSNCSMVGALPKRLDSVNLTYVDLSHNNVTGSVPELPLAMEFLDLSDNMITHDLPNNIGHMMPLLVTLVLARNLINGTIPDSLCELRLLETLDLSKNHLSGNLPDCWTNFQDLQVVRLSFNEISGVIPNSIGGAPMLRRLHLNNNKFTGKLPSTLKNTRFLIALNVAGNSLSGKLPEWIGKYQRYFTVLILRNNEFSGTIPLAFCQLLELQVMDIANNKLTGNIPHCFGNLSRMTQRDSISYWPGWDKESLRQVIKGMELEYTTNSRLVFNLDLSSNYLVGEIPSALTTLSALISLNLSHNHLSGEIPAKIGDLKMLLSLDLSSNGLSGKIPESLSNLSFLGHLNFSNNDLSGQIPTGNQLQTLNDPSIYEGNPQLCGSPLPKKCSSDELPSPEEHEARGEDTTDKALFYGFIVAGFATGFWGLIGVLVFKINWRRAFVKFIGMAAEKMVGC